MTKKVLIKLFISAILTSCVKKRDLSQNTVITHILSQPDGLHPYNNNSVMRSYIFSYTQKTLLRLDLKSLDYIPSLIKELPTASDANKVSEPNCNNSTFENRDFRSSLITVSSSESALDFPPQLLSETKKAKDSIKNV